MSSERQIDPDALSRRIQEECLKRGWTMSELVRRTRINRGTLYRLARGETSHPQVKTIHALAQAFDVPVVSLLRPGVTPQSFDRRLNTAREFDRDTNPVVTEVVREQPALFAGWSEDDMDELYSLFGTGGQLTRAGVTSAAESINCKRETIQKLHVILETGLKEAAVDLIDVLYRLVHVAPATGKPDLRLTEFETKASPESSSPERDD